ncbi:MAG: DUF4131 domain-containing protein, partial [Burkholderiaceae bacterium]|nr:DUF4131 domain-containing protein [Burkholderiaceae bacterium]
MADAEIIKLARYGLRFIMRVRLPLSRGGDKHNRDNFGDNRSYALSCPFIRHGYSLVAVSGRPAGCAAAFGCKARFAGVALALLAGAAWADWRAQERLADALPSGNEGRDIEITGVVAGLPQAVERGLRFDFDVEQASATVPTHISLAWYRGWRAQEDDDLLLVIPACAAMTENRNTTSSSKETHPMIAKRTFLAAALALAGGAAFAQSAPLRIGLIATYSGPYADYGRQFDAGVALWLKEHGGKIAGHAVEIVKKDNAGPAPDTAKRLAQELIVRDKVNVLTGLDFSPNAYAVAPIATQAKVPALVMNA